MTERTQAIGTDAAIDWLLASKEPAIRHLCRRDILHERVEPDPEAILRGPIVLALLGVAQMRAVSSGPFPPKRQHDCFRKSSARRSGPTLA